MFTKNNLPTSGDKDVLREKIAEDIRQYLKNGGQVTKLSRGESAMEQATIDWESRQKARGKIHEQGK